MRLGARGSRRAAPLACAASGFTKPFTQAGARRAAQPGQQPRRPRAPLQGLWGQGMTPDNPPTPLLTRAPSAAPAQGPSAEPAAAAWFHVTARRLVACAGRLLAQHRGRRAGGVGGRRGRDRRGRRDRRRGHNRRRRRCWHCAAHTYMSFEYAKHVCSVCLLLQPCLGLVQKPVQVPPPLQRRMHGCWPGLQRRAPPASALRPGCSTIHALILTVCLRTACLRKRTWGIAWQDHELSRPGNVSGQASSALASLSGEAEARRLCSNMARLQ